ncbi:MAG: hypothetical protein Q7S58_12820 [Candidatus Binatus sp.]|uniref:hypothetical protein n=1 Tax=Candidatus Binatus sp. TaxID=2811406 RepID=UPI002728F252|nr:hypothetical protein [Candidatus Binatus sp.]MDO8433282.1 hypothetical protein [Candidatus Binatus sp.]
MPVLFWYLQGALTLVIAVVAVNIARQQSKTSAEKLKFDLFDKRYRVFEEILTLLKIMYPKGTVELIDIATFNGRTVESKFLFGNEIVEYIKQISDHAQTLETVNSEMRDALNGVLGSDRLKLVQERREVMQWVRDQFNVVGEKFKKYLDFTKL